MIQWSDALARALHSGNAEWMKSALAEVPPAVLHLAVPQIAAIGEQLSRDGKPEQALVYFEQLAALTPAEARWQRRCSELQLALGRVDAAVEAAERAIAAAPNDSHVLCIAAEALHARGDLRAARAALQQAVERAPVDAAVKERLRVLEEELRKRELLDRITQAEQAPQTPTAPPDLPEVAFDPTWSAAPEIDPATDERMVEGLRQHLRRYSSLQAPKNAIRRLEHAPWNAAWGRALDDVAGRSVVLWGSELGVLAHRALQRGAARVTIVEPMPHAARIAAGLVQKNQLLSWHREHGSVLADASEDERRASFEAHASNVPVLAPDAEQLRGLHADVFVFADLDHTILGTGLLHAVRKFRLAGGTIDRIVPNAARVFAIAVEWTYPGTDYDLAPLNELRWSFMPESLESGQGWTALSEPIELVRLDFDALNAPQEWSGMLRATRAGRVDAIVFWAEWELGDARLSAAPGTDGGVLPAVQFTDPFDVAEGSDIALAIEATDTRLTVQALPPARELRRARLPTWYVPMLHDQARNDAYRASLEALHAQRPIGRVLDIGAGCGLLSMLAASAGAEHVHGCEFNPGILRVGREIVARNGFAERITLVGKDCRQLRVPDDLPVRADLAIFELFDCSLLGEGVLHFLAHAREHLLQPDARYLPIGAVVRAQLVEYRFDRVLDVDVNLLNPYRHAQGFMNVDAANLAYRSLSEPFDLFHFDFRTAVPRPEHVERIVPAIDDGIAGAVLFWFDLQLAQDTWLSNAPGASLHWKQALQFLPEVTVERDMPLPLMARHDGASTAFKWKEEALPQAAMSRLPLFDPRMLQEAADLDQRTQQLMQHLAGDPQAARYTEVVGVASRFAIDPAAHGIDGRIAHRFASSFYIG